MKFCAVIVAAGRGVRFGRPKQLVEVAGRPLVAWSMSVFAQMRELDDLVIATESDHAEQMRRLAATYATRLESTVVAGGETRQASVRLALAAIPAHCDAVLVHDGARPLVQADDVRAGMRAVEAGRAALLAEPVVDTIKLLAPDGHRVERTLDRRRLWAAQTPQLATLLDLRRAHEAAQWEGFEATDDAVLLERCGVEVTVVASSGENFKVTRRSDRDLAEAVLRERASLAKR